MKVPSLDECESLMKEFAVPQHIRAHSEAVRKAANSICKSILAAGGKVDADCVDRAALMHDFLKMHCVKNSCRHALEAGKILSERGFAEFGEIVRLHGLDEVLHFTKSTLLEAKVVWYADKRVKHDKVVSLKERYEYLKQKYGSNGGQAMGQILATEKPGFALEKELSLLAKKNEYLEALHA